ncbi:hypothetical protein KEM56_002037, partial [Ascosphaera pollenicola]
MADSSHDSLIAQLVGIAHVQPSEAQHYLESSNWDLNAALELVYEHNTFDTNDNDDEDQHAPTPAPAPAAPAPAASRAREKARRATACVHVCADAADDAERSSRRRDASPGQASMRSGTSRRSVSPGPPGPRDAAAAAAAYHSSSTNSRHRYSQQNMPSNVPPANNNGPPRSLSYSPLPHQGGAQQGSGSRYARHVSPGTSPSSSAALQRGGAPPASPRAYPSR